MQINHKDKTISIPSINTEEFKDTEFLFNQATNIIKEFHNDELNQNQKKEILEMAEETDGGMEKGIRRERYDGIYGGGQGWYAENVSD